MWPRSAGPAQAPRPHTAKGAAVPVRTADGATRTTETLRRYRRACDYLAAAMIHLKDNFLLTEPLRAEHLKPRPLGHWGTCPGLTLVYSGLNRLVADTGQ